MIKKIVITACSVLALTVAAALQAQDQSSAEKFSRADTDRNECVDWEELRNQGAIIFGTLDLNGDGVINGDEHPNAVNAEGEKIQPSSVDHEAFNAAFKKAFDQGDKDKSGCLDFEEWDS